MPEVWFIRHGESIANIGHATRTPEEAELTPEGRKQAQYVATYIQYAAKGKLVKIISSSYERAKQTAQYTHHRISGTSIDIWPVDEFNYLALPSNTSTTTQDRLPLVKKFWARNSPFFQYQGRAESFAQFVKRAQKVIEDLCLCKDDQLIVVFSHQQFIHAVKWLLERRWEMRDCDPQPREMSYFRNLLKTHPMPNGAILRTRLNSSTQLVLSGFEVSHFPSKSSCVAIVPYVKAQPQDVAVAPYMDARVSEEVTTEPLPLGAGY
jgi:broad specificity phosphatase PhoE